MNATNRRNGNERRAANRDRSVPMNGQEKSRRIDLGLTLLSCRAIPGVCYTQDEIAAWAGCTSGMIYLIEQKAMRKVINYLRFRQPQLYRDLAIEFFERRSGATPSPRTL